MRRIARKRPAAARVTEASLRDVETLCQLRVAMLEGFRPYSVAERRTMLAALRVYFRTMMKHGDVRAWFVKKGPEIVATGAYVAFHRPPRHAHRMAGEAYLFSFYTLPQQRRKGHATRLLRHVVAQARAAGFTRVWLRASDEGAKVYRKAGFCRPANVMELDLA